MTCVTPCDLCHTLESLHLAEGARDQSSFFVPGPAVQGRSSRAPSPAWRVTFLPRHPRMSSRRKRLCAGCTSQTRQDDLYSCGPTVNKLTQRLSYSSSYGQHAYLDTSIPGILTVTDARFPLLMKTLSPNSPLLPLALSAICSGQRLSCLHRLPLHCVFPSLRTPRRGQLGLHPSSR